MRRSGKIQKVHEMSFNWSPDPLKSFSMRNYASYVVVFKGTNVILYTPLLQETKHYKNTNLCANI